MVPPSWSPAMPQVASSQGPPLQILVAEQEDHEGGDSLLLVYHAELHRMQQPPAGDKPSLWIFGCQEKTIRGANLTKVGVTLKSPGE